MARCEKLKNYSINGGRGGDRTAILMVWFVLLSSSAFSQFVQVPVPDLAGVAEGSVSWADYDNDGLMDFLLSGSLQLSLWHNTGKGFSNVTAKVVPGLKGMFDNSIAWGDFDNDGRLDLLVT